APTAKATASGARRNAKRKRETVEAAFNMLPLSLLKSGRLGICRCARLAHPEQLSGLSALPRFLNSSESNVTGVQYGRIAAQFAGQVERYAHSVLPHYSCRRICLCAPDGRAGPRSTPFALSQ